MKIRHYINLVAAVLLLSGCVNYADDVVRPVYTVGEEDNEIVLMAGVKDGGTSVTTRALDPDHTRHTPFETATKMALRINGTWLGHIPEDVSKSTTATITTNKVKDDLHNEVKFSGTETCYWDDYGTADPANMSLKDDSDIEQHVGNGRDLGLTIHAACVEGEATAPAITSWTAQAWNVGTPSDGVIDQKAGWSGVDLLTSNNVTAIADGTYKFDDWMKDLKESTSTASNLLIFTHAMTKMTVELTAGLGFVGGKFVTNPTVTLLGFNYTGIVNVEGKSSTPTAATAKIAMHLNDGGAGKTTATYDALVFPGNTFGDGTDILTLTADGNTYFVTAAKLNEAIQAAITNKATTGYPGTNNSLLQGWNYKLKIIVNQTGIKVEATIVDWKEVQAEEEAPVINVDYAYGHVPGTKLEDGFTLYRSTTITGSYIGTGDKADVSYADNKYTMAPQLYWPTHSIHYFFRGVWPIVDSKDADEAQIGPTAAQVKANAVDVANVAYQKGYYPSDLMIARPLNAAETATDEACKVHSGTQGICATTGNIRMNFRYMMSQVKVELTSSADDADDHITFDANTKVEILGGYTDGAIKLSDCTVDFNGKTKADYPLHNIAATDYDSFHDAIIPQPLEGLKFRITTQNADGSTDTYEAVIKDIKVKEGTADPALITAWTSGKAYTYTLKITKTAINVTATLTDWVTVEASDNTWF